LLLILVTFGGLAIHRRAMRDLVGERDVRAVRAAASALFEQLNHRRIAVRTLAMSASTVSDTGELDELLLRSEFLLPFFDRGLAFYNLNGHLLADTGRPEFWDNLSEIPEFKQLLKPTDQAQITTVSNPDTGDPIVLVSFATSSNRVAVGALSPNSLIGRALADVILPSEGSVAYVVNENGILLYQAGHSIVPFSISTHPGIAQALEGISGATYLPVDGKEHVIAYSPIPLVDWALVVEEPWATVATPLLDLTEQAPLVLIPVVVLSMIALWFATQRIVQPLKNLESRTTRLAWGDFKAIEEPVGGINEIRHLQVELIHMAKKLRAAQQGLRNYIGAMTQGQEEERRRLARELHDDTLQSLIALKQRVQLAELSRNGGVERNGLKEIEGLIDQTIQNLRRVTRALRPIYLEDLGLVPALEMLAKEVETTNGIEVQFQQSGTEKRLSPTTELALYRMAQEALSNAIRHANASQAAVDIQYNADEVRLQVTDNGKGFAVPESPAEFAPGGHYGLLGMHERAEMIGARLEIESQVSQGTRITVVLVDRGIT
jgi:signal transduction histidine kinase